MSDSPDSRDEGLDQRAEQLFARRLRSVEEVLGSKLDQESVLVNLQSQLYFGLDEVGTRFWDVLLAEPTVGAAFQVLLQEYEVAPETLKQDLVVFVEALLDHGLVELVDA